MKKRLADWLEKVSVAALAIGLFQQKLSGIFVAAFALAWSMWLTKRMGDEK